MKAMQDWYSVWSRKLGGNDPLARWGFGEEDIYEDVARYWYKRANDEAQGTVIERRYFDDEGREAVDLYAHKSLIFGGQPCHPHHPIVVFAGGDLEVVGLVKSFWIERTKAPASEGVAKCSWRTVEVHEHSKVIVERWLVEAHGFEASVHRLDRN